MNEQAKPPPTVFEVVLEALPDLPGGPTPEQRLRALLKRALRGHRLRCRSVRELPPDPLPQRKEQRP